MLFLDELAEFDRGVLDALREPLEEGSIQLSRAHGQVRASVASRVAEARGRADRRNRGRPNASLSGAEAVRACRLEPAAIRLLTDLVAETHLSARAAHRIVRIARSVADLRGVERVDEAAVLAAVALRARDLVLAPSLAA